MSSLEVAFLFLIVITTAGLIVIPKRMNNFLSIASVLLIVSAIAQILIEGYYWQFLPSYALMLFLIVAAYYLKRTDSKIKKRFVQIILFFLLVAAVAPWAIFLPIPKMIEPRGRYNVGTRIFRWIDHNRKEEITSDTTDRRNVIVQAWYPTEQDAKGTHSVYLDGQKNLPQKIGILPDFIFDHYDQIETHGLLNAPISKAKNKWPIILFLTGNGACRAFYTSLVAGLASNGYVVLTIDHPYEAMITQLADGTVVTPIEIFVKGERDLTNFMKRRLDLRIADIQFVLSQLDSSKSAPDNFMSSLDKNRIAITGHSLGGATAAVAMALDSRIKAAANIDGTLYGELPIPGGPRPFLLIESNKQESDRYVRYENGNQKLFKQFGGGFRYEIVDADHYSFTDAPLLMASPTRFIAGRFLGFGNKPMMTHHVTTDFLNAFFINTLNGKRPNLDSVVSHYPFIKHKRIDEPL